MTIQKGDTKNEVLELVSENVTQRTSRGICSLTGSIWRREGSHGLFSASGFRDVAGAPPTGRFAFPRHLLLPLKEGVWK